MEEPFDFFTWIKEASTIRGLVIVAGLLGYSGASWANAETLQSLILFGVPALYGLFNMFRKDSSKK